MPLGFSFDCSLANTHKFTGKELDSETGLGLYYFGARYYDPGIGRFVTPDPGQPDLNDPQTLNPYAYCLNNPLRYVDPTGMFVEELKNWVFGRGWIENEVWAQREATYENMTSSFSPFLNFISLLTSEKLTEGQRQEYLERYSKEFGLSAALMLGTGELGTKGGGFKIQKLGGKSKDVVGKRMVVDTKKGMGYQIHRKHLSGAHRTRGAHIQKMKLVQHSKKPGMWRVIKRNVKTWEIWPWNW